MSKKKGLVSLWVLCMFNAGPQAVILVPYRSGDEDELGPVVRSDYFGIVPPDRLKVTPEAILLRADAHWRSKIGVSPARAKPVLGAIDFQAGVLTLASLTLPEDPQKAIYLNSKFGKHQDNPFKGDCVNSYNDGPLKPGQKGLGPFFELESLSPAAVLQTGQSLSHRHRTVHVLASPEILAELAREALGVDLEKVRRGMKLP